MEELSPRVAERVSEEVASIIIRMRCGNCALSMAKLTLALSAREQKKLETLLSSDMRLVAAFEWYQSQAKTIDLVANLGFGGLSEDQAGGFSKLCDKLIADRIEAGLTMDDVLTLFRSSGPDSHLHRLPQQVSLQLIALGHEVQEGRFVYRRYRNVRR